MTSGISCPTPAPAPAPGASVPPLALTMGEPAGIGGDITIIAYARHAQAAASNHRLPTFFVIDSPERLDALAHRLDIPVKVREISAPEEAAAVFHDALPVLRQDLPTPVEPGRPDPANGPSVISAIERAVTLAQEGRAGGVVTNPINKAVLKQAGFRHPGHTEFLAELAGGATPGHDARMPRPAGGAGYRTSVPARRRRCASARNHRGAWPSDRRRPPR